VGVLMLFGILGLHALEQLHTEFAAKPLPEAGPQIAPAAVRSEPPDRFR
jgi:hypothetical protein